MNIGLFLRFPNPETSPSSALTHQTSQEESFQNWRKNSLPGKTSGHFFT